MNDSNLTTTILTNLSSDGNSTVYMVGGELIDEALIARTTLFEHASLINGAVCMALGGPLNLLLIWVVAFRSPDELRDYKKVLLQVGMLDIVFLALCFLVQPVSPHFP